MEEIDNLSYWDFLDVIDYLTATSEHDSGGGKFKKLTSAHKTILQRRKDLADKEGIKHV
jgi:hypothetical protein